MRRGAGVGTTPIHHVISFSLREQDVHYIIHNQQETKTTIQWIT
jgi:hypothetical protein